ncbi:MAG: TonB-dependent hemoglobin/transferrin/lactoferrin family receptor [Acidobacteria bacterium]|nr:TonB-dependent hemoglobin/transferrin/lactoferrin family receptor [Acidobacteriota bacterium]
MRAPVIALVTLSLAWGAFAQSSTTQQQQPPTPPALQEEITVTATKTEHPTASVAGEVSVITAEEMKAHMVEGIQDVVRYEPGVTVHADRGRYGNAGYTIRGIEGNRILLLVDGVRVPDLLEGAIPLGRDYVDPSTLKRVEILRGPASGLYGSDALGGVVAYATKDPRDFLGADGIGGGSLLSQYDTAASGTNETLSYAHRTAGGIESLVMLTRRDASELDNRGPLTPNPQDDGLTSGLAKILFHNVPNHEVRLVVDGLLRKTNTNVASAAGPVTGAPGSRIVSQLAEDERRRYRFSVDDVWQRSNVAFDSLTWKLYAQHGETTEHLDESRFSGTTQLLRISDNLFRQRETGGDLQAEKRFGTQHQLIYGAEVIRTESERLRDRTQINVATGAATKTISGENFPYKTFPDATTLRSGVFVQDEMTFAGGRVLVTPAIRVDSYRMDPHPDADFDRQNLHGFEIETVNDTAVSPKLGVVAQVSATHSVYAQYARGFRSPPYDNAGIAFTNAVFGYEILPNADLKPELSNGFDAGVRGRRGLASYSFGAFYNRYSNFIDTGFLGISNGLQQFQYQNIGTARIYGAEARGAMSLSSLGSTFDNAAVIATAAYANGRNTETDARLASVEPFTATLGLQHTIGRFGYELVPTHAASRAQADTGLATPSYTILDAYTTLQITQKLRLMAAVLNLADKEYWRWSNVQFLGASNAIQRYSEPGRNARIGFEWSF